MHRSADQCRALRESLRVWRFSAAKSKQLPAYYVFSDQVLDAIVESMPRSSVDLQRIKGLGPGKIAEYGAAILSICGERFAAAAAATGDIPAAPQFTEAQRQRMAHNRQIALQRKEKSSQKQAVEEAEVVDEMAEVEDDDFLAVIDALEAEAHSAQLSQASQQMFADGMDEFLATVDEHAMTAEHRRAQLSQSAQLSQGSQHSQPSLFSLPSGGGSKSKDRQHNETPAAVTSPPAAGALSTSNAIAASATSAAVLELDFEVVEIDNLDFDALEAHTLKKKRLNQTPAPADAARASSQGSEDEKAKTVTCAGVYVLELTSDFYYVGKSQDLPKRIQQHMATDCQMASAWVKKHGPVRKCHTPLVPRMEDLNQWELKETVVRMMQHGPEKVRGWGFTETGPLTPEHCATIKTFIFEDGDLCRKCGGRYVCVSVSVCHHVCASVRLCVCVCLFRCS